MNELIELCHGLQAIIMTGPRAFKYDLPNGWFKSVETLGSGDTAEATTKLYIKRLFPEEELALLDKDALETILHTKLLQLGYDVIAVKIIWDCV